MKKQYEEMIKRGISPCFEVGESVIYFEIDKEEKGFNVGTVCNVGLLTDFHFDYDNCFSFDENLQSMVEQAEDFYKE